MDKDRADLAAASALSLVQITSCKKMNIRWDNFTDHKMMSIMKHILKAKCKKSSRLVSSTPSSIQKTGTNKRRQVRLY